MSFHRIAAIVPMRHDSKRVPGKNWRPLGGKPLFCHILATLEQCDLISQIVIDTDSDTIRSIARREFPRVLLLDRPEHLRDDRTPMNEVLLHTTTEVKADCYLQTHSTNPFLRPQTIRQAIGRFIESSNLYDSLFGVTRLQQRLWDHLTRPINHDPAVLLRTQDLQPVYVENSCLYLFTRKTLTTYKSRVGANPVMFEIDRMEAWDIDDETDFALAELIHARLQSTQRSAA